MKAPSRQPGHATGARRHLFVAGLLIATVVAVWTVNPAFASAQNLRDLLVQSAPTVIVACGMTFVVLTGEVDISVGSLMGLLAALMGILASPQRMGLPAPLVIALTLAAGAGVGVVTGLLVTVGRVPSIIATLGMMTILRGVTELMMNGEWITDLPSAIRVLGTGSIAHVPVSVVAAVFVLMGSLVLGHRTRLGLRIYAIGGNPAAASAARVRTRRVRAFTFALTGLLTGVAALVAVPQQSVIESGIGAGFELVVVTAVVVGGTSVRGGYGGVVGTLLAALLLGSIRTSIVFLKLGDMATYWERAIQGGFILAAVIADHLAIAGAHARAGAGAAA